MPSTGPDAHPSGGGVEDSEPLISGVFELFQADSAEPLGFSQQICCYLSSHVRCSLKLCLWQQCSSSSLLLALHVCARPAHDEGLSETAAVAFERVHVESWRIYSHVYDCVQVTAACCVEW